MIKMPVKIAPLIIILAAMFFYSVKINARIFYVITGSMEPLVPTGSLIISRQINIRSVRVGSVIVFNDKSNHKITAHRVVEIQDDGFVTQGDANAYRDRYLVEPQDIVGVVLLVLPFSFGSLKEGILLLLLQLIFCLLFLKLGITHRKFLLFLRYGLSCPTSTFGPFYRLRFFRRAKKAFCGGSQDTSSCQL